MHNDQQWVIFFSFYVTIQNNPNSSACKLGGHAPGSFTSIVSGARFPQTVQHDLDLLDQFSKLARPGSRITIVQAIGTGGRIFSKDKLISAIKLAGLVGVQEPKDVLVSEDEKNQIAESLNVNPADFQLVEIQCMVPNFASGSSAKLSFASKIKKPAEKKVWNLMDSDNEDDEDLINENDLLDEEDMAKPDQASLRGECFLAANEKINQIRFFFLCSLRYDWET